MEKIDTNITEAYCLFDQEATDISIDSPCFFWGMIVSDDKDSLQNGMISEYVNPKIANALESIGSGEEAEAWFSVPEDLFNYLPQNPQAVIDNMNDKLKRVGIEDVKFIFITNSTEKID